MKLSPATKHQLEALTCLLPEVFISLQSRADFGRNKAVQDLVYRLDAYRLELRTLQANSTPSSQLIDAVAHNSEHYILPPVSTLINKNTTMMKMGPLNLRQTIDPSAARRQNQILFETLQQCEDLVALLKGGDNSSLPPKIIPLPIQPKPPRLIPYGPSTVPKLPPTSTLYNMISEVTQARLAKILADATKSTGSNNDDG